MYGSIARSRLKPGKREQFERWMEEQGQQSPPGHVSFTVYRSDTDPNELWTAIVFESKQAYQANSNSPETDAMYRQLVEFFTGPPEWHDGEVLVHM